MDHLSRAGTSGPNVAVWRCCRYLLVEKYEYDKLYATSRDWETRYSVVTCKKHVVLKRKPLNALIAPAESTFRPQLFALPFFT